MKSILKKLCKAALALSLAFTGVLYSTVSAKANEIVPYATPQSRTDTITVGGSNSLNVTLKLDFYIDATGLMGFTNKVTCSPSVSGQTCKIVSKSSSGQSQTGSTSVMYVFVTYQSKEPDGETWEVQYRFKYTNNTLRERLKLSETKK